MMKLKKIVNRIKIPRVIMLSLLMVSLLLRIAAEKINGFSEFYCQNIYQYMVFFFSSITGVVPFSIAEIIVIILPIVLILYFLLLIIKIIKKKKEGRKLLIRFFLNLLCTVSVLAFLFMTNCGINYDRNTAAEIYHLQPKEVSAEELCRVCIIIADGAAQSREKIEKENHNFFNNETPEKAQQAVNSLSESYDSLFRTGARPKNILLSRWMSYTKITGVYFPYTFESNINSDVPDYTIPATMCHELAHTIGIMREDEANFTAFLACINSREPELAYSGYMLAYAYLGNALYKADQELYYQAAAHVSDSMWKDIEENNRYWEQFETPVAETASNINHHYLQSNAQKDGVKSYGKVTDLIIAYYSQNA